MTDETDFPHDSDRLGLFLYTFELAPLVGLIAVDARQALEEIEMPPGATEFAIGGRLQADLLLLPDNLFDLAVFDFLEGGGANRTVCELGARVFQRGGPQKTADMIGTKRGLVAGVHLFEGPSLWPTATTLRTNPRVVRKLPNPLNFDLGILHNLPPTWNFRAQKSRELPGVLPSGSMPIVDIDGQTLAL